MMNSLLNPFRSEGRISRLLLALYVAINLLVLVNVALQSPLIGYDTAEHLKNVQALAHLSWPTAQQSLEFFSPPLPYFIPAIVLAAGAKLWWAGKTGQLVNFLLSLGLTYFLLRLCDDIAPGEKRFKLLALGLLGLIPAYYKTFSQMRGEPFLAFFVLFDLHLAVQIFIRKETRPRNVVLLGLGLGLAVLSRQWGFFLFPALLVIVLLLTLRDLSHWKTRIFPLAAVLALSFVVGSGFYFYLYNQYGTFTAFNRSANHSPQPLDFFQNLGKGKLFTDPVRPTFGIQFIPILYSDIWGDYEAYFSIYAKDTRYGYDSYLPGYELESILQSGRPPDWLETNRFTFNKYLGRVNLVSILPSLLFLAGFLYGLYLLWPLVHAPDGRAYTFGLISLFTLISVVGYLWFVFSYPNLGDGDTIKAVYVSYLFPLVALQTAALLQKVRTKGVIPTLGILLALIALYDLPAMLTHFIEFPH